MRFAATSCFRFFSIMQVRELRTFQFIMDDTNIFISIVSDFIHKINKRSRRKGLSSKTVSWLNLEKRTQIVAFRIQHLNSPREQDPPPRIVNSGIRSINIQYGHPVSTKKMKKPNTKADTKEVQQDAEKLQSFHRRIVIVKRRLKKPTVSVSRRGYFPNFHTLTL